MNTDDLVIQRLTITPDMAIQYLQRAFKHQRPLRPYTVKYYVQHMTRGTWDPNSVIRFCVVDDEEYLIDGQHRLNAVVKAGTPQTFIVYHQVVPDLETVGRIYTTLDKGLTRSIKDDLRARETADHLGITATQAGNLASAMPLLIAKFNKVDQKGIHPDDRLEMMELYLPAFQKFLEATAGVDRVMRSKLDRAATLSVALVTFRYSAKHYLDHNVSDFWSGVAFDDGLRRDDPRKYCHNFLLTSGMTGSWARSTPYNKVMPAPTSARYIANYFNAWIENRSLQQSIKVLDPYKPIIILGSPFNGKATP